VTAPAGQPPLAAILLDIEGTTTPIAFVHDVLFPFARARLREYLGDPEQAAAMEELMNRDVKSPVLKDIQGKIWERGYQTGELAGEIFPDTAPAIRRWRAAGLQVAIYSSGSVLAQRLLFSSTPDGDLTPLINGFFDTGVGPKTSPDSYARIAREWGLPPGGIMFISDVTAELKAADSAGMQTRLSIRPGNSPQPDAGAFVQIHSFDEIGTTG
jgi:enolase-phosphatase E1